MNIGHYKIQNIVTNKSVNKEKFKIMFSNNTNCAHAHEICGILRKSISVCYFINKQMKVQATQALGCLKAKPAHNDTNNGLCSFETTKLLCIISDIFHDVEWMHRLFYKLSKW